MLGSRLISRYESSQLARSYDVYVCENLYVFGCPVFICQLRRLSLIVKIFGPGLGINVGSGN